MVRPPPPDLSPPYLEVPLEHRGKRKIFGHGFSHGSVTVLITIKHLSTSSFFTVKNG
jgi:hypothetical protein